MKSITYNWMPGEFVSRELLVECASLYSGHYGRWSEHSPRRAGQPVRLSIDRLRAYVSTPDSKLALAYDGPLLVGYAMAVQSSIEGRGIASWVTQLVVREDYRNQGVAKTLLFSIWGFSDHYAWGLVTANPFAVRALEKATRRRCNVERIWLGRNPLMVLGDRLVPYVDRNTELAISYRGSVINTEFFVDHATVEDKLREVTTGSVPWRLSELDEGWEWFAFTFRDQPQIQLTEEEIDKMLSTSDQVTMRAYSRMLLNSDHKWARHTSHEVSVAIEACGLGQESTVIDFGCGLGRHVLELASRGFDVTGVDYLPEFVAKAQGEAAEKRFDRARFLIGDCRDVRVGYEADAVLCLYDVVGTFIEESENLRVLQNIARHLKPGGRLLLSVMNHDLTLELAKQWFSLRNEPDRLLALKPSRTMETSGNIFNPDFFMVERDTGIVYRKEQFAEGHLLPSELIVRDKRFGQTEIEDLCKRAGLEVEWSRPVRIGHWDEEAVSPHVGKEILLLCKRPDVA